METFDEIKNELKQLNKYVVNNTSFEKKVKWWFLIGLIPLVIGATFCLTKLSYDNLISSYQLKISMMDRQLNEYSNLQQNNYNKEQTSIDSVESNIDIEFINPKNNSRINQFTDIQYRIHGKIPNNYRPVLLIRDPLGQYWSWGTAKEFKSVQIGQNTDVGRQFELVILITNNEISLGQPSQTLPKGIFHKSIRVLRK